MAAGHVNPSEQPEGVAKEGSQGNSAKTAAVVDDLLS
jgi:hypothetical protein